MKYQHIFFDLDHTLWDFDRNSKAALSDVYYEFDLRQFQIASPQHFQEVYGPINERMWVQYRLGEIDAETVKIGRFRESLKRFGVVDEDLVRAAKSFYLNQLPLKGYLMPNTKEALTYLQTKYKLHVVTNGFRAVTERKIAHSDIGAFFESTLSAEEVGVLKPNRAVFDRALSMNNATTDNSLFVGDNLIADVQGAQGVGMDQVFFNPHQKAHNETPTFEIKDMKEMVELF